jgi:S1-C subfamily serine protease
MLDYRSPQPPEEQEQPKKRFRVRIQTDRLRAVAKQILPIAAGVIITLLILALYNFARPGPQPLTQKELDTHIAAVMASATPPPALSERVYEQVQPSLVQIETKILSTDGKEEGGRGAGVIIDDSGQVLTSLHVVANAIDIEVLFMDGTRSPASVVNSQPQNDIALLKPQNPPSQIFPATLGNSNSLRVGDEAFALGSPFGLTGSESAGIVSGLNRVYHPNATTNMEGMIQFDTAVNPGNSGGPLVDRYGEVVGIVTGLLNPTDQNFFVGIGFAVPINAAAGAAGPNPF